MVRAALEAGSYCLPNNKTAEAETFFSDPAVGVGREVSRKNWRFLRENWRFTDLLQDAKLS